jgi:hypothetical protein
VISALSGVRDVIVEAQGRLLDAAVAAGVPRFIPSDFAVDFRGHRAGTNRNLDLRREFMDRLDAAPIRATSVLCGMFTDLLKGTAPMVIAPIRRVVYWGNADQRLDFTTISDTASFTAKAALDPEAPRWLRIAGEATTARGVARSASAAWGRPFGLLLARVQLPHQADEQRKHARRAFRVSGLGPAVRAPARRLAAHAFSAHPPGAAVEPWRAGGLPRLARDAILPQHVRGRGHFRRARQ